MLARDPRGRPGAFSTFAVALLASGDSFGRDPIQVNFLPFSGESAADLGLRRFLAREVLCQPGHHCVVEFARNAPHVTLRTRVFSPVTAKALELRHNVIGLLTVQPGEYRRHAVALRPMALLTDRHNLGFRGCPDGRSEAGTGCRAKRRRKPETYCC